MNEYNRQARLDLMEEQHEHAKTQRWCDMYRRLALVGWIAFVLSILWHDEYAYAETLPRSSIACVDAAAWFHQQHGDTSLAEGCVYTRRTYYARIEALVAFYGATVWLYPENRLVWVDAGDLLP